MSDRTAQQAAIKRATIAAQREVVQLDASMLDELEKIYRKAAADLSDRIAAHGGADGNLSLQEMQSVLDQVNARLRMLSNERDVLLNRGLTAAVELGTQPLAKEAAISAAAAMKINHDALQFVRTFIAEDGLQLSDRLWRIDRQVRDLITNSIEMAVVQGHGAAQAAREFLAKGEPVPIDVLDKTHASNAIKIAKEATDTAFTGEGSPMDNAKRLMRTEINRAHGEAYIKGSLSHPDAAGIRFLLSPAHPKPDICDFYSIANLHGLGQGVYPDRAQCPWPAHPNTLSFVEVVFKDEITAADRAGKETPLQAMARLSPEQRKGALGVKKSDAFDNGQLTQGMIRTPWKTVSQRIGDVPVKIPRAVPPSTPKVQDSRQWIIENATPKFKMAGATSAQVDSIRKGLESVLGDSGLRVGEIGWMPRTRARANAYYQHYLFAHQPGINDGMYFSKPYSRDPELAAKKAREAFRYNKETNIQRLEQQLSDSAMSERQKERMREKLRVINAAIRWSSSSDATDPLFATAAHETGHAVYYSSPQIPAIWESKLHEYGVTKIDMAKVSEYAASKVEELFAEVTALIADGKGDEVPNKIMRAYQAAIERKT